MNDTLHKGPAAHDLAQWVTFMLTMARQSKADLSGLYAEIAFTSEERSFILNLAQNANAQQKVRNAAASEEVRLTCEELCQLLMALSSPLKNARGHSEKMLSNLASKVIHQVSDLLTMKVGDFGPARSRTRRTRIKCLVH